MGDDLISIFFFKVDLSSCERAAIDMNESKIFA